MGVIIDDDFFDHRSDFNQSFQNVSTVFQPCTPLEMDFLEFFHEYKSEGCTSFFFFEDGFSHTYEFGAGRRGTDPWEVYDVLCKPGSAMNVLAAMSLTKTFEEQWPYSSGDLFSPETLRVRPLITIPPRDNLEKAVIVSNGARRFPPGFIRGIVPK